MSTTPKTPASVVQNLCTACGLCCNGVLFADVRLQPADSPQRLTELGVPLKHHKNSVRFRQPCACLDGTFCRIYAHRPSRCRTFECRLLQRTMQGEVKETAALKIIAQARRQAELVRDILRALGDNDESIPLNRRYARMMRQPMDLAGNRRALTLRGKLMRSVADLAATLQREFIH